jgi:hypothetical protein
MGLEDGSSKSQTQVFGLRSMPCVEGQMRSWGEGREVCEVGISIPGVERQVN